MKKLMKRLSAGCWLLAVSGWLLSAGAAFGDPVTIKVNELSGSVEKDEYTYDGSTHLLTLLKGQFVLTGSSPDVSVHVRENVESVRLDGLKLEHANGKGAPISLEDMATTYVFALTNANVLVAPPQCAAIEVPRNATLTIGADDDAAELNAVGGGAGEGDNDEPSDEYGDDPENGSEGGGAGIGMGWNADCGTIVILGGKVTATGGNKAAGIGGGAAGGCAGNVEIFGGTILSAGGWGAAGIGSGYEQGNDQEFTPSHNGKIVISGGRVTAKGGDGGAGIGGGGYWRRAKYRPKGPDVEISGGTVSAKGGKAVRYKGWKTSYSPWDFGAGSNPDDEKLPKVVVRGGTVYATNSDDSWHFNKEPCQSAGDEWPVGGGLSCLRQARFVGCGCEGRGGRAAAGLRCQGPVCERGRRSLFLSPRRQEGHLRRLVEGCGRDCCLEAILGRALRVEDRGPAADGRRASRQRRGDQQFHIGTGMGQG